MSGQTRRNAMLGGAVAALMVAAGAIYEWPRLVGQKFKGPYADLVAKLPDAKAASVVGRALPAIDASALLGKADALRLRLANQSLEATLQVDLARGDLSEAQGWVLPEALGLLCVAAAHSL